MNTKLTKWSGFSTCQYVIKVKKNLKKCCEILRIRTYVPLLYLPNETYALITN